MFGQDTKSCTLVGSDKGGVGKSMVALIMALVFDKAGVPLKVVEIDNQRKLTNVLGADRVDLALAAAPELTSLSRDRHAALSYFNPVYQEWASGASVTDLGANVTTSLMAWFRQCDIGELAAEDGIDFRFVACASPDDQAIRSAVAAVEDANATLGPSARYYIVLNDLFGLQGFEPYGNNEAYERLLQLEDRDLVKVIRIPFCESLLLEHGKAMGYNPLEVVHRADEIALAANLDLVGARVQKRKMVKWLMDVQSALEPLLTVRAPQPQAARAFAAA